MESDTKRLALVSVILGIAAVTLLPVHADIAQGLHPGLSADLLTRLLGNIRETDAIDLTQNVLLFVPFGYLVAASDGSAKTRRRRLFETCLAGLVLSGAAETLQFWIPGRYSSLSDIFINVLGAGLGGLASLKGPFRDDYAL